MRQHPKAEEDQMNFTSVGEKQTCNENGLIFDINSLSDYLGKVTDRRKPKGVRYSLANILILILLAKMGGEDNPTGMADWIAEREEDLIELLKLPRKRVPHHTTYRRVLQQVIEPAHFEEVMAKYQQNRAEGKEEVVVSIDGKTLRGTIPGGELRGEHLLAAYLPDAGLVLMEIAVDKKENEIVVAPQVLKALDLKGKIVIGDAMHAQRQVSIQIVEAGGDFAWTIKGNQSRTEWAIQHLFANEVANLKKGAPLSRRFQSASQPTTKAHGRIEKRSILVSQELNDYLDWPHVSQVFRIEREIWHNHGQRRTRQVVYGLTSLTPQQATPRRLLFLMRHYWGIENGLHYRRDVTLREDDTRSLVGHAGHNLAIINNLVISLCLSNGLKNVAKARRLFDAKPDRALQLVCSA
jgi:predicted transposase YbfD/YdcC